MPETTWREYSAKLRANGWINRGQGWWVHESGAEFYAWDSRIAPDGRVIEAWQLLAEAGELPETEVKENG